MQYLPAIELLESTYRFPGSYLFKVIGRSDQGFVARTVAAVRDAVAAERIHRFPCVKRPEASMSR